MSTALQVTQNQPRIYSGSSMVIRYAMIAIRLLQIIMFIPLRISLKTLAGLNSCRTFKIKHIAFIFQLFHAVPICLWILQTHIRIAWNQGRYFFHKTIISDEAHT